MFLTMKNTNAFSRNRYTRLFFIDHQDIEVFYGDMEAEYDWSLLRGIPEEEKQHYAFDYDETYLLWEAIIEGLQCDLTKRFSCFRKSDKRIRKGLWAIAESDLFYVCYEETEKGVAVGMLQKNSLSILGCPQNAHCEKYKSGIRDALLDQVYEVEEYAPEGQNKNAEESFASENDGQRDPTLL